MAVPDWAKFVCKKCGEVFCMMPISHGVCHVTFYPSKPKPTVHCDGEVVPILEVET